MYSSAAFDFEAEEEAEEEAANDGDNNDGDLNDWQRQSNTALITVWSAPTENLNLYATYSWMKSDLDVPACIPVFDG